MRTTCLLLLLSGVAQAALPLQPSGAAGRYDVATWKQERSGCPWEDGVAEGRIDVIVHGEEKRWRVSYAVGQIGPSDGGAAWNQPFAPTEEITLSYVVRFSPGFDWVKGGKLPGLGGGEKTTGGRPADGLNGQRSTAIHAQGPVGDVVVMPDPVHQLAAAVVHVPVVVRNSVLNNFCLVISRQSNLRSSS